MSDDPKEEGLGGYCISQDGETFGPYPFNKPWPEIAEEINAFYASRRVAEALENYEGDPTISVTEDDNGSVTLTFHSDPEWQAEIEKPSLIRRMWDHFVSTLWWGTLFVVMAVIVGGLFIGLYKALESEQGERRKAERLPVVEEKLKEACRLLDEVGFDGDPRPCLDEDGKPIN